MVEQASNIKLNFQNQIRSLEAARDAMDEMRLRLSLKKFAEIRLGSKLFYTRILDSETKPSLKLEN